MGFIGSCFEKLDHWAGSFSIEVFASVLKNEWIQQALVCSNRQTQRQRKLSAPFTVWLVIALSVFRPLSIQNVLRRLGNIPGVGSLWKEGKAPASSSVVEARNRLGITPFRILGERFGEQILATYRDAMSWKGLGLLALDGTTFKVTDSGENRRRFGLPPSRRGRAAFPQMRALFLVSARMHFVLSALFAPYRRGELPLALKMLPSIPRNSLVLMDRYYNSWQLLIALWRAQSHFLVRLNRRRMKGKKVQILGPGDRRMEFRIPCGARRRCRSLPKSVMAREITVRIHGRWYRFLTSLLDPVVYPAAELVSLYQQRWEEELVLDEIKTHQCDLATVSRPVLFRSTSSRRVLQEAQALVLAYNLIRILMAQAAERRKIPPLRLSFVDSLEQIRSAMLLMAAASAWALPNLFEDLINSLGRTVIPARRVRKNPRAVCVQSTSYRVKRKKRPA